MDIGRKVAHVVSILFPTQPLAHRFSSVAAAWLGVQKHTGGQLLRIAGSGKMVRWYSPDSGLLTPDKRRMLCSIVYHRSSSTPVP